MDVSIVDRKTFFDNMGDNILPSTKYRWNAIDLDVEVYDDKHVTHAMTLLQERIAGVQTIVFIPQRQEEMEEGVRVVLGSSKKLEVYYISYTNLNVKITKISSVDFDKLLQDKKEKKVPVISTKTEPILSHSSNGKMVATPCHILLVRNEDCHGMETTVIHIFPLRKYYCNSYEIQMGILNECRDGDTTTDLPNISKIILPGVEDLVVVNHKVVVVRDLKSSGVEIEENNTKELYVMEPLPVRLCQEIQNDLDKNLPRFKGKEDVSGIEIAVSFKIYYEVSVILEGYLSDTRHFMRRKYNNWTDKFWREQMSDEAIVVRNTLKQIYSIIAEELLESKKGQLAAFYFARAKSEFSYIVNRFMSSEVKSCVNAYFDEVFFNADRESGAILMASEYEKVFKLLEDDCDKRIQIAVLPLFQNKQKELSSLQHISDHRSKIKSEMSLKRKGTKEYEHLLLLEASCVIAQYLLLLNNNPNDVQNFDVFKELNSRGPNIELDVFRKFTYIFFDTNDIKHFKQPIVSVIEQTRPLLFIRLMLEDITLAEKYIQTESKSEVIRLVAYEMLYERNKSYAKELVKQYIKLVDTKLEFPCHKEYDKEHQLVFERFHDNSNSTPSEWIPKELLKNIYIRKILSILAQLEIVLDDDIGISNTTNHHILFIKEYSKRKVDCARFVKYLYENYTDSVLGYIQDICNNQHALELISVEAINFEHTLRDKVFDVVSTHVSINQFCKIVSQNNTDMDFAPYLRKCIGNAFYNKHLTHLCDAFPKDIN